LREGDRYLELDWDTPQSDGGTEIEYQIIFKGTNISDLSFLTSLSSDVLEFNDTTVTNGVRYYYALTCVNSMGESARSNIVQGTPSGLPSPPLVLKAFPNDRSVLLTWEHPLSDGGALVNSYDIFRNEKGREFRSLTSLPSTQSNFTDNEVTNGVLYHYKIRAVNDNGHSEFSSEVEALPLGPPTIPEPFIVTSGNRFIEIGWTDLKSNGGDPTCKVLVLRAHGVGIDENNLKDHPELVITLAIVPATTGFYNDTTPKNGIKYFYSLIAENKAGRSERSDWISSTSHGPPSIIENLTVGAENGIVELIWSKPIEDGGLPLISIEVHKRRGQEQTEKVIELDPDMTQYHDKDVRNGTFYHYYLISRNALRTSPPSIEVTVIPRGPPFPVQNLTVKLLDGKVLIEWKAPESDGGYEITDYTVSRQYNGGTFILLGNVGPNTCNWTDISPPSGLNTYRVSAINGFGESGPSYSDEIRVQRGVGHTKDQSWMLIVLGSLTLLVICVLTTLAVILKRRGRSPDYTKGVQVTPPTDRS
jgi:titin